MPVQSHPIQMDRVLSKDLEIPTSEADMFGIEIELEGKNIITQLPSIREYWATHVDGSLRQKAPGDEAIEYVFKKPLNFENTSIALERLFQYLNNGPGVVVYDSYRTSIHVHVNCLQETMRTIVNFITLSIIFDELFVSQNGETRIGNNFCLRTRDAEGQVEGLCQSINKYGSLFNLSQNDRYSSVNFASLLKFGTIEFRSLECTTHLERVMHWIKTVQALKESARKYENPQEIISRFSRHGPLGFMIAHLGKQYEKYAAVPLAHQMLHNGMRLAQDFAFCSEWKSVPVVERAPAPRKKKVIQQNLEEFLAPGQWAQPAGGQWPMPQPDEMWQQFNPVAQAAVPGINQVEPFQINIIEPADPGIEDDEFDQMMQEMMEEDEDDDEQL